MNAVFVQPDERQWSLPDHIIFYVMEAAMRADIQFRSSNLDAWGGFGVVYYSLAAIANIKTGYVRH